MEEKAPESVGLKERTKAFLVEYLPQNQSEVVDLHFDFVTPAFPWLSHRTLQIVRSILLIPPMLIFMLTLLKIRRSAMFIFLTQWGLHLSLVATILTIQAG